MKKFLIVFLFLILSTKFVYGDFKSIKKKATVQKPEIIFPIKNDKKNVLPIYI